MKRIVGYIITILYTSACTEPNGILKRSVSGKIIDAQSYSKRATLYNKKDFGQAKHNIADSLDTRLLPDQLYEPAEVNQNIYRQMLKNQMEQTKNDDQMPKLTELTSSSGVQQELQELRSAVKSLRNKFQEVTHRAKNSNVTRSTKDTRVVRAMPLALPKPIAVREQKKMYPTN